MNIKKSVAFIHGILFLGFFSFAQNEQTDYLAAKQHLAVGSYKLAMESFKRLSDPNSKHDFVEYASFYYALAAYKNGDLGLARSMWLQVEKKYPKWNKIREVYFWLAQVYFEEGNYSKGVYYARQSRTAQESNLIYNYITEITDIEELKKLHNQYPDDKEIAVSLASAIVEQPLSKRDFNKLEQIATQFNLDQSILGLPDIGHSLTKPTYDVAVLLPFMFDGLDNTKRVSRNKFVMDIYEGILEAVDTLNSAKKVMNVFPYDTKRNAKTTRSILKREEMGSMDLIIGPLFPGPSKEVYDFCFENRINMINPISSNSKVVDNNPYSFLFMPANENLALTLSEYAIENFSKKNALIFYDASEKDSIAAYTYKEKIIDEGFEVIQCAKVDNDKIGMANLLLTNLFEVGLTETERDSLLLINENLVKERKVQMEDEMPDSTFYYREYFTIAPDSIGHIFVSSSKPLHASSFISAVEIRPDTIPLLTNGNWMDFEMLTIDQMERLSIKFAHPKFIDLDKESFKIFRKKIQRKYKKEPSINNYIGYELAYYVGNMMKEYGHYFQKGAIQSGFVKGQIFEGVNYGIFNSNQYVPIATFENAELKKIK